MSHFKWLRHDDILTQFQFHSQAAATCQFRPFILLLVLPGSARCHFAAIKTQCALIKQM